MPPLVLEDPEDSSGTETESNLDTATSSAPPLVIPQHPATAVDGAEEDEAAERGEVDEQSQAQEELQSGARTSLTNQETTGENGANAHSAAQDVETSPSVDNEEAEGEEDMDKLDPAERQLELEATADDTETPEHNESEMAAEEEEEDSGIEEEEDHQHDQTSGEEVEDEHSAAEEVEDDRSAAEEEEDEKEHCITCNESLDEDPALTCDDCGAKTHSSCVEPNPSDKPADESSWRCADCIRKSSESESPREEKKREKNKAPRLVRDLLPVSRGIQKPNAHSIFNQPLIEDEDGGRALRKRKSPTADPPLLSEKKRRRLTDSAASMTPVRKASEKTDGDRVVAHSTRRTSHVQRPIPTARTLQHRPYNKAPPYKFILAFHLDQSKIEEILSKPPRPGRRRDRKKQQKIVAPPVFHPPVPKFPALPTNHLIFPSMWHARDDEINSKPYGGILTEAEADTSRSLPQMRDREMFENARKEAEEERRKTSAAAEAEINGENAPGSKPNRTVSGPPSKIKCIQFGKYVIDTFYAAPYPEEYSHESRLFICEFCLKYLPSEFVAYRHKLKCPAKHPPGDEIYRDGTVSIWEVDGRKKTEYCQCLCLMAKMFLGSKTLYYDVEPFLFYILTEYDELGYHFVGYFSKEKRPASQNNVSCILVMPIHQRKGYATFLIDFSYLLTRIEGKEGSPEKPLSDMGLTAYRSYWDWTISKHLLENGLKSFSTKDLMRRTGMTADDVIHSLERLYALVRDPVTRVYAIRHDKKLYESIVSDFESKRYRKLRPELLVWTPYIMGRSDQQALDTQPIHALAGREVEDMDLEGPEDVGSSGTDSQHGKSSVNGGTQAQYPEEVSVSEPADRSEDVQNIDPLLLNSNNHVAPGPPSTEGLSAVIPSLTSNAENVAGSLTNGTVKVLENIGEDSHSQAPLTGYALAYRTLAIPPTRFEIVPPIPPAMLRHRSTKRRGFGSTAARQKATGLNGSPAVVTPVRSSPRHAASVNGSRGSRAGSPEKVLTPIRRSGRKSGLANVESLQQADGEEEDAEGEDDVAARDEEEEAGDEGEEESGSEEAEAEGEEEGDEEEDEEDEDAEVEVQEEEDDSNDEDAEPPDEDEDEDEDAEVEGDEDDDDEEEEEDDDDDS